MDLIILTLLGLAFYYKMYTLAVVLGGVLVCAVGGIVQENINAETKKCNLVTATIVVNLLRQDIADPENLRARRRALECG